MPAATTLNQVVMQLSTAIAVSAASLQFYVSSFARAIDQGPPNLIDCRFALVVMAAMALIAILPLRRLRANAGANLSGYRGHEVTA